MVVVRPSDPVDVMVMTDETPFEGPKPPGFPEPPVPPEPAELLLPPLGHDGGEAGQVGPGPAPGTGAGAIAQPPLGDSVLPLKALIQNS